MRLTTHLTIAEGVSSPTAKSRGILNIPSTEVRETMVHTALNIFEKVRTGLGNRPIAVTSFYRSPELNKLIGGSATSQHCKGEALDMDGDVYGGPTNLEIFNFIRKNLEFDQLIIEGIVKGKPSWIHCSYCKTGNRKKITFMYTAGGKKVYEPFSEKRYNELIY